MRITGLEPLGKGRSRVYVEEQLAFVLYKGELSRYHIEEGGEITEEDYEEIIREVLVKRAKARSLYLLKSMDRTESQLRRKLKQGDFPEQVIDEAIEYVKSFHYIDDRRYAESYIRYRMESKSKRQITGELLEKGVPRDIIAEVYEEMEPADELAMIRRLVEKKKIDPETATPAELRKLYMFLARKGFSGHDISKVLHNMEDFTE